MQVLGFRTGKSRFRSIKKNHEIKFHSRFFRYFRESYFNYLIHTKVNQRWNLAIHVKKLITCSDEKSAMVTTTITMSIIQKSAHYIDCKNFCRINVWRDERVYVQDINDITNCPSSIESESWRLYWRTPVNVQTIFHIGTDLRRRSQFPNAKYRLALFLP